MEIKTTKFQELSISDARSIENYANNIRIYTELDQVFAGVDLHCCSYVTAYKSTDGAYTVSLWLAEEHKNVKLASILARKFHCRFDKSKNYDGTALELNAKTLDGKLSIQINGYVPDTCRIVEKEIPLSASELAALPTTKKVREIQCGRPSVSVPKALPAPEVPVIEAAFVEVPGADS